MGSLIPPVVPVVVGGAERGRRRAAPIDLADSTAGDFYGYCMAQGGALPPGLGSHDKACCELVLQWFNAITNSDEKALLKPTKAGHAIPSEGDRRRTIDLLQKLVIARLSEEFTGLGQDELPCWLQGKLTVTALEYRLRVLRALPALKPVVTAGLFAVWRKAHELKELQEGGDARCSERPRTT